MTRGMEALLRKILNTVAALLLLLALALGAKVLTFHPTPGVDAVAISGKSSANVKPDPVDPRLSRLAQLKMSRPGAVLIENTAKPAAPALSSLIRVKGIMDFGDPNTTEAIIETMRLNKTSNYKLGQNVEGVSATITKIDSGVTFNYDGKTVSLNVNGGESAEIPPTASNGGMPVVADDIKSRHNP